MKKFHIVKLGCPKNDADMEILKGLLLSKGYKHENNPQFADYIFIDTCGFIEEAKKESIETIFEYTSLKDNNKNPKVIPIGCLTQRYFNEFLENVPEIDGLYGVLSPKTIVEKIENGEFFFKNDIPETLYNCKIRAVPNSYYAYVKIGDGCNRNCTFCSIPTFKGKPKSRSIEEINEEVEFLVSKGVKEIILVSQDNTLYGIDNYKKQALPDLLDKLNDIRGKFWIRVMYLHPDFLSEEIIESIHRNEKVLNYFDVPIQHISDKILQSMGRHKKRSELMKLFEKIRKEPSVIRTTLMVGFPGEKVEDFEELVDFVKEVKFERMGSFKFSKEENTRSFTFPEQIDEHIKNQRQNELMAVQSKISKNLMEKYTDKSLEVLLEEKEDNVYIGRSFLDAPEIDGNVYIKNFGDKEPYLGDFVKVRITGSYEYDLEGEIVEHEHTKFFKLF
ncbi:MULTISPECIES: 30S ribosomal protein S12 methylthiotransferase RimO [Petrotoga]|uniref:Ribosomal protein uS12 methylthiotransferase RimO n=2 Tax=Petrotoga sibirica TaxID=156202 RepID=A0A4R8EUZ4_9BACT|nr:MULTISPECIES: 30S ribosomal protein S12 methylthiotransferase RimO [Petrotoga]POZ89429.1 ribosomal protein S12 methylthiotransferase RimO [Petrotoga sibirica DSM 13575]POZ91871.1 ribosomal protein S12 methylthiotransferase RimO [Petrotoga sp. SL27]TDX16226.1 SSU ribosomal protein S12P methylthiotransferase [Petrotoga sibirica]